MICNIKECQYRDKLGKCIYSSCKRPELYNLYNKQSIKPITKYNGTGMISNDAIIHDHTIKKY